jgi:hypothetical protein
MDRTKVMKELADNGIGFTVYIPDVWGSRERGLSVNDVPMYLADPAAFFGKHHCVTKEQYLAWQEAKCSVQCAATTSKGKRCGNTVKGGSSIDAVTWVKMQGEYCIVHSGEHEPFK